MYPLASALAATKSKSQQTMAGGQGFIPRRALAPGTSGIFAEIPLPKARKWPFPVATTIMVRASSRKANKRSLYSRAILHSASA